MVAGVVAGVLQVDPMAPPKEELAKMPAGWSMPATPYLKVIKALLKAGASPLAGAKGASSLLLAVQANMVEAIEAMLRHAPCGKYPRSLATRTRLVARKTRAHASARGAARGNGRGGALVVDRGPWGSVALSRLARL